MNTARTPREQLDGMNRLISEALKLSPMARLAVAADLLAAQMQLNEMFIKKLDQLQRGDDGENR